MQIRTLSCPAEQWAPRSAQSRCQQRLASRFWNPCRPRAHIAREGLCPRAVSSWEQSGQGGQVPATRRRVRGRKTLQNGSGVQPHWPCGGRDTRGGHTQAQASLLRYRPVSSDSLYLPLPRKRRAALAASGPVFSLMGRHGTLLHVGLCLKMASRAHCHWLGRTDPVGSTITRPGRSPPGTRGPPWGRPASCARGPSGLLRTDHWV